MSQNHLEKRCFKEEGRARLLQQGEKGAGAEEGAGAEAGGPGGGQAQDPQWGEADEN